MKIAFYNNGIPFDGRTPWTQPLGGSETSVIHMARSLARIGHAVSVYCNCPDPGSYGGVEYFHHHRFFDHFRTAPWDALVAFRSFDPFLIGRVAPRMIFWSGDAHDQPVIANLGHSIIQSNLDLVLCVSEWHRRNFIETFSLDAGKVVATRNGFLPEMAPKIRNRTLTNGVYSSTPFRGLNILLKIFPELQKRAGMTLDVFSSMKVYGWSSEDDHRAYGELYKLAEQPGVKWHGSVEQPRLLRALAGSGFLLYPNTFDETSCIAAIEAQACGAVVITSARAGLRETVEHGKTGVCIPGDPRSDAYQEEFVKTVLGLVASPDRLREMSRAARDRAFRLYSWEAISTEWSAMIEDLPPTPVSPRWSGPLILLEKCHYYLEKGNIPASRKILASLDAIPFFRNQVEEIRTKLETKDQGRSYATNT